MQNSPPGEATLLLGGSRPKGSLWATVSFVGATGFGFVADGYDLSSIDLVVAILNKLHSEHMEVKHKSAAVAACLVGVMIGQLFFGAAVDVVGRRVCGLTTAVITMVGAAASACVLHTDTFHIAYQLALCRFVLGLGIGGEYPVSAAMTAEAYSSPTFKGVVGSPYQLLVSNMLFFKAGQMLTPLVVLMLMASGLRLDTVWRVALGLGMVPSCIALAFRWNMHDTLALEEVKQVIDHHVDADPKDTGVVRNVRRTLAVIRPRLPILIGASIIYCMGNSIAYGMGSFKSLVAEEIFGSSARHEETIHRDAIFGMFFTAFPVAAYVIIFFVLGLRPSCFQMQTILFSGLAATFALAAMLVIYLPDHVHWPLVELLMVVGTLSALSSVPQYLLVPQHFPAVARGTCQGIASCSGKFGATLGTTFMPLLADRFGLQAAFYAYAMAGILGLLTTFLLTPRVDDDPENVDKLAAGEAMKTM